MKICIVGAGYVGLTASVALARSGHQVITVEKDKSRLNRLRQGVSTIYEPGVNDLLRAEEVKGKLTFTDTLVDGLADAQIAMVAVGTPSLSDGRIDLTAINEVCQEIACIARSRLIVVMKSTVPPGTGKRLCERFFSSCPADIRYVSNPEFLREGSALHDWYHPDRIVVGSSDLGAAKDVLTLYEDIEAPKLVVSVASAELAKYASNAFLATKISFINEVANLCELVGADIEEVAAALGQDSRIGHKFLKAGIGYGGSCFPKDTKALDYVSSFNGYTFSVLKAVIEVNVRQRIRAVHKLSLTLGGLGNKRIAVLGLAFKPETDDVREAPALDIINYLVSEGATVTAYDPVACENARKHLAQGVLICEDPYDATRGCQAILVATEWDEFTTLDWSRVKQQMREPFLVFDGRNCLDAERLRSLGFLYIGVGRGYGLARVTAE